MTLALIAWHPLLPPFMCGLLIVMAAGWGFLLYKRMATRLAPRKAALLIVPKALTLLLLLIATLNPFWTATHRRRQDSSVLLVRDVSASMDTQDAERSRSDRAADMVRRFRRQLPSSITLDTMSFDTVLRPESGAPDHDTGGGTDIGGCLLALSERSDLSSYAAVVLLTDGGDEALDVSPALGMPLHIVSIGSDPEGWRDLAIAEVETPESVERETDFEIRVQILAHTAGDNAFAQRLKHVDLTLERREPGGWVQVEKRGVNLSNRRARITFRTRCPEDGLQHYRVTAPTIQGEISALNNARTFSIDVRRKSLHVLYLTREFGAEFKMIRNELAADPGVTFTALFRTVGESFTVQGEQVAGAEALGAGLPDDPEVLALFDCLILGSFPASEWTEAQMLAVVRYVDEGGAVIFLGGEASYGGGGYDTTPLAALVPWRMTGVEAVMMHGEFPVSIPLAAGDHPMVAGLGERLAGADEAYVESCNVAGTLKPGAVRLMVAGMTGRTGPLAAVQPYGSGWCLALASNTFWRWALKPGPAATVHGMFWRQAVRNLCGESEGGRVLSVKWDRKGYRPGERAVVEVRVAGDRTGAELRLTAAIDDGDGPVALPVTPVQGRPGVFRLSPRFRKRGIHEVTITATRGERRLESYAKALNIAPLLPEGSRLEVDHAFLEDLAERYAGRYVQETEAETLVQHLKQHGLVKTRVSSTSLVYDGPAYLVLFLVILMAEWILRRRMNLF